MEEGRGGDRQGPGWTSRLNKGLLSFLRFSAADFLVAPETPEPTTINFHPFPTLAPGGLLFLGGDKVGVSEFRVLRMTLICIPKEWDVGVVLFSSLIL